MFCSTHRRRGCWDPADRLVLVKRVVVKLLARQCPVGCSRRVVANVYRTFIYVYIYIYRGIHKHIQTYIYI